MFLLLFIFILSLSVSFSLHFFVIPLCVRISQPAQTALARRLLSLSPLSLRCPCVKCQTLLSGQRRRHLPYRRRQFPASPPHPLYTLHFVHFSGGLFALAAKCLVAWCCPLFSLSSSPFSSSTLSYFATFSVCFALFAASACPAPPCSAVAQLRLPTNFTYIYSDIFQRPLLLLCISYEIVYFSGGVCVSGSGSKCVCVLVKCFHAAQLLKPLLDAATLFRLHPVPTLHSPSLSFSSSLIPLHIVYVECIMVVYF